jgi:hypothetical protein
MGTVSPVQILSTCVSALAVLIAGLAGAASAQAGFVPALGSPFPYAAPTTAVAVADGDRNGTVDVVAGGLDLRRGVGTGFLGNPIRVETTGPVEGLAAGDLNGDGLLDYAAIVPGAPRQVRRYIAIPGNGFAEEVVLPDAGEATDLAVADLDGAGLLDLVVVRRDDADPDGEDGSQDVTVVPGGSLEARHYESGLQSPRDVELGQLGGEGRPDIVVAGTEPRVAVLINDGGGNFAAGYPQATGAAGATRRIALTELNADGHADLLATDSGAAALHVLLGNGAGALQPLGPRATGLAGAAASVAAGDVNGDGVADAVAGGASGFAALLGDAAGGLTPAAGSPFATWVAVPGDTVEDIVVADMNRDGQSDVVTANRNGSASVLLNDGTGLLTATPTGIDFGEVLPASGLLTQTLTLRSTRGALRLTRLDRKGSRNFAVSDVDCLGRTLALGQTCTLSVTFNVPRRARRYEALLSVDANAAALIVPLSATPRPPIVSRTRLKRKRVRRGQRLDLRYRLSEGALTRVLVERARPGRRTARRGCVEPRRGDLQQQSRGDVRKSQRAERKPRRRNLRRRRCTLWHAVGKVGRRDQAGRNRLRVATRGKPRGVGRKRRPGPDYPAGTYRLSISALDHFRNRSEEQRLRFKILRPAKRPRSRRGR